MPIARPIIDALESRLLLSAAFTNDSMAATWGYAGQAAAGAIDFDNAGAITGGFLTDLLGNLIPSGAYTIDADGLITLNSPGPLAGGMTSTQDVIALSTGGATDSLALLTKQGAGFVNADLTGTFSLYANGSTAATTGIGAIKFDGLGHITSGGSLQTSTGKVPINSGSYTVGNAGDVTVSIIFGKGANTTTQTFVGTLSAAGDLLSLSPPDMFAAGPNAMRMLVAVKSAGAYANTALAGTWTVASDGLLGTLELNTSGGIVGGSIVDSSGDTVTPSGTYNLTTNGKLTLNLILTEGLSATSRTLNGNLTATQNVATLEMKPTNNLTVSSAASLFILVHSENRAPTISAIKPLKTAVANTHFDMTFEDLFDNSNAADLDGDAITFKIATIPVNNTVKINGSAAAAGDEISPGDVVTWTGPSQQGGTRTAFTVRAFDGADESLTAAAVKVTTVLKPDVKITASKSTATELNGNTTGAVTFTITRGGNAQVGILSQPLDIAYTITGTATNGVDITQTLTGAATIPANQKFITITVNPVDDGTPEGNQTLILTIVNAPGAEGYLVNPQSPKATVTILDNNTAPTFSTTLPLGTTPPATPLALTFAQLVTATSAVDLQSDPITFKITAVHSGTLTVNGNPVVPGTTTIAAGDTLSWTPPVGLVLGTVSAFSLTATDGGFVTAPKIAKISVA